MTEASLPTMDCSTRKSDPATDFGLQMQDCKKLNALKSFARRISQLSSKNEWVLMCSKGRFEMLSRLRPIHYFPNEPPKLQKLRLDPALMLAVLLFTYHDFLGLPT